MVSISIKSASKFSRFQREKRRVARCASAARSRRALVHESPAITCHAVPPINKSPNSPRKQALFAMSGKIRERTRTQLAARERRANRSRHHEFSREKYFEKSASRTLAK
jgi:hypothetical protein